MPSQPAAGDQLATLVVVMRRLRAECAWKAAQTHRSLVRYLLEEAYELAEAIEHADDRHLREELGDVLLQVLFHAAIAEEEGRFDLDDVAAGLEQKLVRRNPHVFGEDSGAERPRDPASVNERWEQIKATEAGRAGLLDGIPLALPALHRAAKVLERYARDGRPVQVDPESADLGDRLLALVAEAVGDGVDPEQALRHALARLDP